MSIRTTLNAILPKSLYLPRFKSDDVVVSNGNPGERTDLPRFEGDTLYSIPPHAVLLIDSIASGDYSGTSPSSEFEYRELLGTPHYVLEARNDRSIYDNYRGCFLDKSARIPFAANIVDERFESLPVAEEVK